MHRCIPYMYRFVFYHTGHTPSLRHSVEMAKLNMTTIMFMSAHVPMLVISMGEVLPESGGDSSRPADSLSPPGRWEKSHPGRERFVPGLRTASPRPGDGRSLTRDGGDSSRPAVSLSPPLKRVCSPQFTSRRDITRKFARRPASLSVCLPGGRAAVVSACLRALTVCQFSEPTANQSRII